LSAIFCHSATASDRRAGGRTDAGRSSNRYTGTSAAEAARIDDRDDDHQGEFSAPGATRTPA
jgi:hypothetical protein